MGVVVQHSGGLDIGVKLCLALGVQSLIEVILTFIKTVLAEHDSPASQQISPTLKEYSDPFATSVDSLCYTALVKYLDARANLLDGKGFKGSATSPLRSLNGVTINGLPGWQCKDVRALHLCPPQQDLLQDLALQQPHG